MTRPLAVRILLPFAALLSSGAPAGADEDRIAALIQALGSPDWAAREEAQAALVALGCPAAPALEVAARGEADPEIARRAGEAWRRIRSGLPADDLEPERIARLAAWMTAHRSWCESGYGWPELRAAADAARPPLEGRVAGLDPAGGPVRLDAGADRGFVPGLVLLAYRGGSFVATIEVVSADREASVARVVPDRSLRPIEAGDSLTTSDPGRRLEALEFLRAHWDDLREKGCG